MKKNQINLFEESEIDHIFLTKEEQNLFFLSQLEVLPLELDDYKQGYQNAIMDVHRQYNLRSKKVAKNTQ